VLTVQDNHRRSDDMSDWKEENVERRRR